jgi:hypothetical protein
MYFDDLNRAVAARTGEPIREIARRGFIFLARIPIEPDPHSSEVDHQAAEVFVWDELDHLRIGILFPERSRPVVM